MSEVEKMYKNAGIEPERQDCCKIADKYWTSNTESGFEYLMQKECPYNQECTDECEYAYDKIVYPPFTAEKQISILQFCLKWGQVHILNGLDDEYRIENSCYRRGYQPTIADAIANYINEKWEKLTPDECKQIKEILE